MVHPNSQRLFALITILFVLSCNPAIQQSSINTERIVSLDGSITEVLCEIGLENNIVGVDITSTYPASMAALPKAGHNRVINVEAVIAMNPTVIFALEKSLKPETEQQLASAGIPVVICRREYDIRGAKDLIKQVADTLGKGDHVETLWKKIDDDLAGVKKYNNSPKVLFIYARGVGTMSVAGKKTALDKMIELAGGVNAASEVEDFKPFTAESIVKENPDVILFFDSGLESLGGAEGLLKVPGIAATNAGKNKKFITMEGQLLTGFTPRVGKAVAELSQLIHE
ncbi:MAG: ABC transporter substrate-binding protein [Chitinophagaceae bacterium]|nr:ABC transporter substrate-binding protein [Chitinophagaceae bacterium]MCW5925880.1 ABC transporter substrate-binding protein [Chitinophagaceae bacterium]